MSVALRLDSTDPTPAYEQLRRQIASAIIAGMIPAGTRLPTVRQLAGDLGLAPGTVMRAYAELETTGLIISRRGAGTIAADLTGSRPTDSIFRLAVDFVSSSRQLGAHDQMIRDAINRALEEQPEHS